MALILELFITVSCMTGNQDKNRKVTLHKTQEEVKKLKSGMDGYSIKQLSYKYAEHYAH